MTTTTGQPYRTIIETLDNNPRLIRSLMDEFPLHRLKQRPEQGRWSAHEHACHLAVVHPIFFERLDLMLAEQPAVIEPYFPDQAHSDEALLEMDLAESLERFETDRRTLVQRLRGLDEAAWQRPAEHAEYSRYDVVVMFRHLAMHDMFHAYRIEELLLARD